MLVRRSESAVRLIAYSVVLVSSGFFSKKTFPSVVCAATIFGLCMRNLFKYFFGCEVFVSVVFRIITLGDSSGCFGRGVIVGSSAENIAFFASTFSSAMFIDKYKCMRRSQSY